MSEAFLCVATERGGGGGGEGGGEGGGGEGGGEGGGGGGVCGVSTPVSSLNSEEARRFRQNQQKLKKEEWQRKHMVCQLCCVCVSIRYITAGHFLCISPEWPTKIIMKQDMLK